MKKQLTVALGLAVLATPAFATKARLQALGEDVNGSYYINDNRNVWLNAAQVNNHKDLVTYEWGGNVVSDDTSTPRGEGGAFKEMGNLVYGVQFGAASDDVNDVRDAAGLSTVSVDNHWDFFVGGDTGVKWGASLGYGRTDEQDSTAAADTRAESLRARVGAIFGDLQVFGNFNLINNAKGVDGANVVKVEGKNGYHIGAIHAWNGNSIFADYRAIAADFRANGGSEDELSQKDFQVGIGRVTRLNDRANLFTRAALVHTKAENDGSTALLGACSGNIMTCEEYKATYIPVVVGLEHESTSWLTLRASVGAVVWGGEEDKKDERTFSDTVAVNAGATLKFGELSIDGVIGNAGAAGVAGDNTAASNGTLRTDALMTRVGMVYRF